MPSTERASPLPTIKACSLEPLVPEPLAPFSPFCCSEPSFHVASYWRPPRGQKSQHREQPVHILTSVGRSSSPMPMESVGQAATQTPHCTHLSASMTDFSRSQNQTFPGASSMSFINSRISKPAN